MVGKIPNYISAFGNIILNRMFFLRTFLVTPEVKVRFSEFESSVLTITAACSQSLKFTNAGVNHQ